MLWKFRWGEDGGRRVHLLSVNDEDDDKWFQEWFSNRHCDDGDGRMDEWIVGQGRKEWQGGHETLVHSLLEVCTWPRTLLHLWHIHKAIFQEAHPTTN